MTRQPRTPWNLRSLKLRARAVFTPRRAERELDEELAFHLEREAQKHIANGLSPAEARGRAQARFGSLTVAADDCREERGTLWLDNLVRDLLYAGRTVRRAPMAALTIVMTVGLGLGLVTVVFSFMNALVFRVDAVHNPHELFGVARPRATDAGRRPFTRERYESLMRETSVFADAYAIVPEIDSFIDGRTVNAALVTGNFFHVLGVGAARGRTLTPSDDIPGAGNRVMVLSDGAWERLFARDPGVLGRTLLVGGAPYEIVGVMPEDFRGLTVGPPDYWAPLSLASLFARTPESREDAAEIEIIGRLKPGLSRERATAELVAWDLRSLPAGERPSAPIVLEPRQGTAPVDEAMVVVTPLFFSFGLILLIGWANVANLLLARGVARQREIGIRLATGASRTRIICQLLTESLLLALVSAALGFVIAQFGTAAGIHALMSTMPPDIGDIRLGVPPADWRVALFLIGGALVSTVAFALTPALQSTRVELVRAMRGEVVRDARPGRTRSVLIAVQVTASALLLVCSAVFLRSALTASTVDPGFRSDDTVVFDIVNESRREAILDTVRREATVGALAAAWPSGVGLRPGLAAGPTGKSSVAYKFVSPEFFEVLGIGVVRGRGFTPTERSSSAAVAVVSEQAARAMWPDRDPLGQVLQLEPDHTALKATDDEPPLLSRTYVVVGVVRNVPGFRFIPFKQEVIYVPIGVQAARTGLTARVHGDPQLARRILLEKLVTVDPNTQGVITLRTFAGIETYFLGIGFWLTLALGGLALLLTLSGLFSMLSYLVEQRSREIGVRLALGATYQGICVFVLRQLIRPVGVGLIAGAALAAALGAALLTTPAAGIISVSVRLFDPLAYIGSLLGIVAACACAALIPALRAGRIDPVATLRQD